MIDRNHFGSSVLEEAFEPWFISRDWARGDALELVRWIAIRRGVAGIVRPIAVAVDRLRGVRGSLAEPIELGHALDLLGIANRPSGDVADAEGSVS